MYIYIGYSTYIHCVTPSDFELKRKSDVYAINKNKVGALSLYLLYL